MREVAGWVVRFSLWDVLGGIAYTQVFALLESVFLFVGIILLSLILPYGWFRAKRVPMAAVVVLITSLGFVILQYNREIIQNRQWLPIGEGVISYFIALAGAIWLLFRRSSAETAVTLFVRRLAPLSFLYFVIDLISIGLVAIRNL